MTDPDHAMIPHNRDTWRAARQGVCCFTNLRPQENADIATIRRFPRNCGES
jgi:hypothetical protein